MAGPAVLVEFDPRQGDGLDRILYYVYTMDGESIDEMLVREGLAEAWTRDGQHRNVVVTRVLDRLADPTGLPQVLVMDNGPEFTSKAMPCWAQQRGVKLHFIDPGKPRQNAYIESFNGKFRDECLNGQWFSDLQEAGRMIEEWRKDHNLARPHSSLGYLAPETFRQQHELSLSVV
ncbi:MAG: transposase family protein [Chloroflexi bacterium]|nr:transposase family protein [Chloroflexota bacterium]